MKKDFRQRSLLYSMIIVLGALVIALPLGAWQLSKARAAAALVPLSGSTVPALQKPAVLSAAASDKPLQLSVALKLRNESALDNLLKGQNDPTSPLYHKYLTPQQFTDSFGPTMDSVNQVENYLRSQGLSVGSVSPNHTLIHVSSSVAQAEKAFHTSIADYSLNGQTVYAPSVNPLIPASLSSVIQSIIGLDNASQEHPMLSQQAAAGPAGGFTPSDIRSAYDANPLLKDADGTGQTVAIFEESGYIPSDINTYLSYYNLGAPKYSNVFVDNATNTPDANSREVELDMQLLSAVAPGAKQLIYIGTTGADIYNKIATDDLAKIVTTSWGACESYRGTANLAAWDNIFKQFSAQGQTFFAATGDSGAYDCGDTNLAVDSPADDPNAIGVGGTSLTLSSSGGYGSETAWSDPTDTTQGPKGAGGGGGYSTFFAKPSYQTGPGVDSNPMRHVPDVALAGAFHSYSSYCTATVANCTATGWRTVGGTSCGAPIWAGFVADTMEYLTNHHHPTAGSVNQGIYWLFNTHQPFPAYHDITTGNNLYYNAGPGYDLATGVGTPDVWNIVRDITSAY
jgi:subtilase family serine protease